MIRRWAWVMAILSAGGLAPAQAPPVQNRTPPPAHPMFPDGERSELGRKIAAVLSAPEPARAHWGVAVVAMDGTPLFGWNEAQLFRPASNAKLFTTVAAMQRLSYQKVHTWIESRQQPVNGVLHGDLIFESQGDANLSGRHLPYETPAQQAARLKAGSADDPLAAVDALAEEVAATGVRHVTGRVVGLNAGPWEPYAPGWEAEDAVWGYGAPVSLLAVNDSQIEARAVPGSGVGDPVQVVLSPDVGELSLKIEATTVEKGEKAALQFDREPGSRVVRVFGTMALDSPADVEELAVVDPQRFAAEALRQRLIARGVRVDGDAVSEREPLQDARSFRQAAAQPVVHPTWSMGDAIGTPGPGIHIERLAAPLIEDVTVTLKVSQNLHAEMLLRRMGWNLAMQEGKQSQRSWAIEGVRAVRDSLLSDGLDGEDFVFYDGSGLSDKDLVTPRATAQLLAYAATQPWFAPWQAALPVGGVDGSLAGRFKDSPLKGKVFAKTGTLGESRALSGYVECASGKTVAFAIFVDNHLPGHSQGEPIDRIVEAIAAEN